MQRYPGPRPRKDKGRATDGVVSERAPLLHPFARHWTMPSATASPPPRGTPLAKESTFDLPVARASLSRSPEARHSPALAHSPPSGTSSPSCHADHRCVVGSGGEAYLEDATLRRQLALLEAENQVLRERLSETTVAPNALVRELRSEVRALRLARDSAVAALEELQARYMDLAAQPRGRSASAPRALQPPSHASSSLAGSERAATLREPTPSPPLPPPQPAPYTRGVRERSGGSSLQERRSETLEGRAASVDPTSASSKAPASWQQSRQTLFDATTASSLLHREPSYGDAWGQDGSSSQRSESFHESFHLRADSYGRGPLTRSSLPSRKEPLGSQLTNLGDVEALVRRSQRLREMVSLQAGREASYSASL